MTAILLDGKKLAQQIQHQLAQTIDDLTRQGLNAPRLDVILVGDDPASMVYVAHKQKACQQVGVTTCLHRLPVSTTNQQLTELITTLNQNKDVDGILLQLPLPAALNKAEHLEHILPHKDVDGFHPYNQGRLLQSNPALRPCTPFGIIQLLDHYKIDCKGKHAVIIGTSNIVGRPMAMELLLKKATTTLCHQNTVNIEQHIQSAEIIISATGAEQVLNEDWIQAGAVVIDVGIRRDSSGKIRGDIDFERAYKRAGYITPVPGGVGPMTVATLLQNTVKARLLAQ